MSSLELRQIAGVSSVPVVFVHGIAGDGHALTFPPKIVSISPAPFQKNAPISSNIVITFDQEIKFSPFTGEGVFNIRENSINGPIKESFSINNLVTGTSPRLSIGGTTLTIDPTTNFAYGKKYYLEMPNIGIAATLHLGLFAGEDQYYFETPFEAIDAVGGSSYVAYGYKFHVFTGSGTFELNSPSASNTGFEYLVVGGGGAGGSGGPGPGGQTGGGGGGGGVLSGPGETLALEGGYTYTITVGGGGSPTPAGSPSTPGSYDGNPSSITLGPNVIIESYGGGAGGGGPQPTSSISSQAGGSGGGGAGWPSVWDDRPINSGSFDPAQDWHPEGGGGSWPAPTFPTYYYRGSRSHAGRRGVEGQGNNGGFASSGRAGPSNTRMWQGGGGGGAGGVGENASYPNYSWNQYQWPTHTSWPGWACRAGDGGIGRNIPTFSPPLIPSSYIPNPSRTESTGSGRYGGGGGGGSKNSSSYPGYQFTFAGQGGPGGGGHGGGTYPRPSYGMPVRFSPETGDSYTAQSGYNSLGGGGGGGSAYPGNGRNGASGGSGIVIIRYLYPHVNT